MNSRPQISHKVLPELYELPAGDDRIRLVYGGREYFDLLQLLIQQAVKSIHLQVYIFEDDATGHRVADALAGAARRGVEVFLLTDGFGSQGLGNRLVNELVVAGVHFGRFEPLLKSRRFYFGRRLHHKVFVADNSVALVGGINISDKYCGDDENAAWFDVAVFVRGKTAAMLEQVCIKLWNSSGGMPKAFSGVHRQYNNINGLPTVNSIRLRRNDWVKRKMQIWKSYASLMTDAEKEIVIVCSYFLPGWKFRKLMSAAAARGVDVRIIVAGPSDVMIAKHAERYLYRWMLANNIRIYEYQKSVLHAKLALTDGNWMTVGSYNVNNISTYASIELNLDICSTPFVSSVRKHLQSVIANDCREVTLKDYKNDNSWIERVWQRFCYELIKVIMYLFTFYFRQEKEY